MNGRVVPVSPVTGHWQYRHQPPRPGLCPAHSTLWSSQQAEAHIQSKYQWLAEVDITRPRPVLLMSELEMSCDQQKEVVNVGCPPRWPASSGASHLIMSSRLFYQEGTRHLISAAAGTCWSCPIDTIPKSQILIFILSGCHRATMLSYDVAIFRIGSGFNQLSQLGQWLQSLHGASSQASSKRSN